jgi:predicted nucleotide-binding protein
VLFELGWFCGRYGRDNVRILRKKETPLPSDLHGLITIDYNERIEEVYRKIKLDLETMRIVEREADR